MLDGALAAEAGILMPISRATTLGTTITDAIIATGIGGSFAAANAVEDRPEPESLRSGHDLAQREVSPEIGL